MVASQTAVFVQRIIEAGGIVHARTTTPEFSCAPVTWTKLWGVTRNPWNTAFSPGGSSGGSGASLAAGTTTLATGSDIGGSIRIPASFCGVVGFKPPYGRVPEVEIFNLDHYCHEGPMARTVADCALLENVIAGPHPSDVASIRPKLEIPADLGTASGLRIAVSADLGCYNVDADVAANTLAAADRLREAGATVEEVSLPWDLDDDRAGRADPLRHDLRPVDAGIYEQHADELTSYARHFVADAAEIAKDDLVTGLELEGRIYAPLGALLEEYDALICPTFAVPALPAEYDVGDPISVNGKPCANWLDVMMTLPFNIASRCPVLSVPSGLSRDGVPTGLSIVGKTYDDVAAFRVAAAHESTSRGSTSRAAALPCNRRAWPERTSATAAFLTADRRAGDGLGTGRRPGLQVRPTGGGGARVRSAARSRSNQMASRVPPTRGPRRGAPGRVRRSRPHPGLDRSARPSPAPASWPLAG